MPLIARASPSMSKALAKTSIIVPLSSLVAIETSVAVGVSLSGSTLISTTDVDSLPSESFILYSKLSIPLKF